MVFPDDPSFVLDVTPSPTVLSPRLLFSSSFSAGLFYLLLVSLVQTRVLILDSLPIVCPLFFLSLMLVTNNLCRLALWRIARFVCSFNVVSASLSLSFSPILVPRLVIDGAGGCLDW